MLDTHYDHVAVEKDKYDRWVKAGYFTAGDKTKQPFSIVIPPPNVTGKLHLRPRHGYDSGRYHRPLQTDERL
jgi:valyl-tRNA synthetase